MGETRGVKKVEHFENALIPGFRGRARVGSVVESDGFRKQDGINKPASRESNHVLTAEK